MEKKGKVKNTDKILKRTATALLASGMVFFASTIGCGIYASVKADDAYDEFNDLCSKIKASQSYMDFFKEKHADYYEALNNQTLTVRDYADKVEELSANDYVYENVENYAPEEKEKLDILVEESNKYSELALKMGLGGMGATLCCGIPGAIVAGINYERKEMQTL